MVKTLPELTQRQLDHTAILLDEAKRPRRIEAILNGGRAYSTFADLVSLVLGKRTKNITDEHLAELAGHPRLMNALAAGAAEMVELERSQRTHLVKQTLDTTRANAILFVPREVEDARIIDSARRVLAAAELLPMPKNPDNHRAHQLGVQILEAAYLAQGVEAGQVTEWMEEDLRVIHGNIARINAAPDVIMNIKQRRS